MRVDTQDQPELMPGNSPRPQLSLCMIVRDNERTIRPCLESIRPWVDEMIVVDTGSVDTTPKICQELGAKVFHFPWIDDFSAARNESLRHATGEWLFWMDSDDTIDETNGRELQKLAAGTHDKSVLGYVLQVHCPGPDDELTSVDHIKLFRNHQQLRFEGPIHEQVLGGINRLGGEVAFTNLYVVHSGSDSSPAGKHSKVARDLRILQKDLAERPDHPFVLFNFGMTYFDIREYAIAAQWLERCLQVSPSAQSHVRKAYALLVSSLTQLGELKEATEVCAAGRSRYPWDAELLFRQGILAAELGQFPEAVQAFRGAIRTRENRHFSSMEVGITGYRARHNLALVLEKMGCHDQAELEWRMILESRPGYRPAWRGLGDSLLALGRSTTLETELASHRSDPFLRPESFLLEAKVCLANHCRAEARVHLEAAVREFPEDPRCCESLAEFLVHEGHWEAAERALARLTDIDPENGAAWHNLALAAANLGRKLEAVTALRQSLRVRPNAPHTTQMLCQFEAELAQAAA